MGTEDYIYIEDRIILGMVIFLVVLAFLFEGVCILIFSLSRSGTKKFLRQSSQENYRRAKGYYIASIVFMVLISLFTLMGISGFFTSLAEVWDEQDSFERIWYIVEIAEFSTAVIALVLGISALTSFGRARTLYNRLYPPVIPYYNPPQQSYGYPQNYPPQQYPPQRSYPQQTSYNAPPAEKMCPNCGVVNEGKNSFCIFCGRPI